MRIDWDRYRVKFVLGRRVRNEAPWRMVPEWSARLKDFDLWFIWAGRGLMRTHQGDIPLRPGVCLWLRPGGLYVGEHDPRNRIGVTYLHFELVGRDGMLRDYNAPLPPLVNDLTDVSYVDAVTRRIVELSNAGTAGAKQAATALLTGLLIDIDCRSDRMPERGTSPARAHHRELVLRLAASMAEAPGRVPSVQELASRHGYSADHFTRIFKAVVGQSPQEYLVRARVDRACRLLLETSLPIGEIAQTIGYRDLYFFSKQFKQKVGATPSAYRKGGGSQKLR